jgi:parvulin-like peptidyl-prolyl isomerase
MRRQKLAPHALKAGWVALGLVLALVLLLAGCNAARPAPAATAEAALVQAPPPTNTISPPPTEVLPSPTPTLGSSQDGRPLAARVNGQPIFLDVYEKQVTQFEQALTQEGLKLEGEEGKAQLTQIRENVLSGLIKQALIEQAATAEGVVVTDEEVEATVQKSITQGQGQQAFDQWLADNNLTLDEFRATQRTELLTGKVIEHVTASVPNIAEQVHALHIRTSDAAKAQALLDQLKAGANFADLARQASEDTATAANGGDLGWFPHDAPLMPPQVLDAAFALQVGEISQAVKNDLGYDIIKVEAREANRPLTPEMHLYARQRAFEAWLNDQVARAAVERYVNQ